MVLFPPAPTARSNNASQFSTKIDRLAGDPPYALGPFCPIMASWSMIREPAEAPLEMHDEAIDMGAGRDEQVGVRLVLQGHFVYGELQPLARRREDRHLHYMTFTARGARQNCHWQDCWAKAMPKRLDTV
jgi:hypothetical protein